MKAKWKFYFWRLGIIFVWGGRGGSGLQLPRPLGEELRAHSASVSHCCQHNMVTKVIMTMIFLIDNDNDNEDDEDGDNISRERGFDAKQDKFL